MFFHRYQNPDKDDRGVFEKAKEYGNLLLGKTDYNPQWITVITWENLRPKQPGSAVTYGGVSIDGCIYQYIYPFN